MLEASGLHLRRGGRIVLDRVDLTLRPGELLALLGPNGAGKSTLLACLAGVLPPDRGEVRLDGRPLGELAPGQLARRRAVLSQRLDVPPQLLVDELVAFGRQPHRGSLPPAAERRILAAVIEEQGLGHLLGRACGTLSGGELRRAHLARVTAQLRQADGPPAYLLLDEPTANLDLAYQAQILDQARALADAGGGVLAILHDLNQAAQIADRLLILANGRTVAGGPPAAVLTPQLIREVYGVEALVLRHPSTEVPFILTGAPALAAGTAQGAWTCVAGGAPAALAETKIAKEPKERCR